MLQDFYQNYKWDGRPWLIVGMGPTFSHHRDFDLTQYNILGLNKVVREIPVDLCQIIDHYIIDKVKDHIVANSKYLVVPYYPHFWCRPWIELTVHNVMAKDPFLLKMAENERLMAFNLTTAPINLTKSPTVEAHYFSAEAAVSLLANLSVKDIYLLGVDGGRERAGEFSDHGPCDSRGFDLQWTTINKKIKDYNLNVSHLVRNPDGLYPRQETASNATKQD